MTKRASTIVLLSWLSIFLHESGHFLVYTFSGYRVQMSFQRVRPTSDVPALVD
ncbi:MAG TPA: hypothetical protein VI758_11810 [Bacteroidota bacterium]